MIGNQYTLTGIQGPMPIDNYIAKLESDNAQINYNFEPIVGYQSVAKAKQNGTYNWMIELNQMNCSRYK